MPPAGSALSAGRVGKPHGLDGSFHVTWPRSDLLTEGMPLLVAGEERVIERRAGLDARPILRLSGVGDRAGAEALRGEDLWIARENLPALAEGEFWAEDVEGIEVHAAGEAIGSVKRMLSLPSCEVLEVARPGKDLLLVPLVRDAVLSLDLEARRIEIDLAFLGEEDGS